MAIRKLSRRPIPQTPEEYIAEHDNAAADMLHDYMDGEDDEYGYVPSWLLETPEPPKNKKRRKS